MCCRSQLEAVSTAVIGDAGSRGCPSTWDGYTCWDVASAGDVVLTSCPGYIPHAIPSGTCIVMGHPGYICTSKHGTSRVYMYK